MITRNYKCSYSNPYIEDTDNFFYSDNNLNNCSRELQDIKIIKQLGKGSYGTVYFAEGVDKNNKQINLAIKKIIIPINSYSKTEIMNKLFEEIEYSYYMGEVDLAPKIYDSFYIQKYNEIIQYIIMEPGMTSVEKILKDPLLEKNFKLQMIYEMIQLIERSIFDYDMYCIDIKPANFVVMIDNSVKLIDFGRDFCKLNDTPFFNHIDKIEKRKNFFFYLVIFQLMFMMNKYFQEDYFLIPFEKYLDNDYINLLKRYIKLYQEPSDLPFTFYTGVTHQNFDKKLNEMKNIINNQLLKNQLTYEFSKKLKHNPKKKSLKRKPKKTSLKKSF